MSSSSSGRVPDTATAAMRVLCRHLSLGLQGCAARSNRPCQPGLGCPWFQAEAGTAPPSGSHGIALRLSPGISLTTPTPPAQPRASVRSAAACSLLKSSLAWHRVLKLRGERVLAGGRQCLAGSQRGPGTGAPLVSGADLVLHQCWRPCGGPTAPALASRPQFCLHFVLLKK